MNFFDAQDRARRTTRWLIVVYILATVLIVLGVTLLVGYLLFGTSYEGQRYSLPQMISARPVPLLTTALLTTLLIVGASIVKTGILSSGGGRVARDMGGTLVAADTRDPLRQRLRNVVEEMAIASGVPVPEIYVLEEETAINAFAAGYAPGDAAIAVTRGTLEMLDRDELQGVIAHEFSHVLNGDMRLNIRLMGVLFGILLIGMTGRLIMRGGHRARLVSSRNSRGAPVILAIGLGLALLGWIGVFFARLIKAGVSRQREYLADASAVQFTRLPDGIASALKKIGGYAEASYLQADPEEISHMLFGSGAKFTGLFATHPPLAERIRAIDPSFRESDYPDVRTRPVGAIAQVDAVSAAAAVMPAAMPREEVAALPEAVIEAAGNPDDAHVAYAQRLRSAIPPVLYDAAHSVEQALLLTIALIVERDGGSTSRQLAIVEEQLGTRRAESVRRLHRELAATRQEYRLPLLEIAFPALKLRPEAQLEYIVDLASRLIDVDGRVDLYEYCFFRVLRVSLGQAVDPGGRGRRFSRSDLREAALDLLTVVADYGSEDTAANEQAYLAGSALFGKWAKNHKYSPKEQYSLATLDRSLDVLGALKTKGRRVLLEAITTVTSHDGRVTISEAELIRTICASLDVPLPPLLMETAPDE